MIKNTHLILILIPFFTVLNVAQAGYLEAKNLPEKKHTKAGLYLNSKDAYEMLEKEGNQSLFIDVRTRAEVAFGGMPDIADANIPFKFMSKRYKWNEKKNNFKMTPNPDFVSRVVSKVMQKKLTKSDKVFVMCRSGARSAKAADALTAAGFTQVISVVDGYDGDKSKSGINKGKRVINGWKNSNLPWSESLDKNKMYLADDLKNKDGKLKMLEKMDVDKNGIVTQDEFNKYHKMMFGKIDQDHNEVIDSNEFKTFKKNKKQEKKKNKQ